MIREYIREAVPYLFVALPAFIILIQLFRPMGGM